MFIPGTKKNSNKKTKQKTNKQQQKQTYPLINHKECAVLQFELDSLIWTNTYYETLVL